MLPGEAKSEKSYCQTSEASSGHELVTGDQNTEDALKKGAQCSGARFVLRNDAKLSHHTEAVH
jgi:hypothetical protein